MEATGISYKLVQQTRVNGLSKVEGEALLTRFPIAETGNLDYQTRDIVALVARVVVEGTPVDLYVTHLYMSRGDDSLRLSQVQQLLAWIDTRADGTRAVLRSSIRQSAESQRERRIVLSRYAAALQSLVSAGARDRLARAEEPVVRRLSAGGRWIRTFGSARKGRPI